MLTIDEAIQSLGIDYADDVVKANVRRKLAAAQQTLYGAVGEDVFELLPDDGRAVELLTTYLEDLYYNQGVSAKVSGATRRMVADMELQLRMELRKLREAGGGL